MRCGCPECGTYMIQAESLELGCVCPACGRRCKDCLGTNTLIDREEIRAWKARGREDGDELSSCKTRGDT